MKQIEILVNYVSLKRNQLVQLGMLNLRSHETKSSIRLLKNSWLELRRGARDKELAEEAMGKK